MTNNMGEKESDSFHINNSETIRWQKIMKDFVGLKLIRQTVGYIVRNIVLFS